jgi:outer membrane protein assembly factor BamB
MKQFRIAVLLLIAPFSTPAAPPQATAFQITVDHAGVTTSGGALALQQTPLWTVDLPGNISYPLIAEGGVFVTSAGIPGGGNGTQLYALDAQTGKNLWGPVALPGTYQYSLITYDAGSVFVVNSDGILSSFNAATGAPGWSVQLPGQYSFSSPPTASNGVIYIGGSGDGGTLYAVSETSGAVLWSNLVENGDNSSPAVGPSGVYVSYPCQVYDFDLVSGTPLWRYNGGCEGGGGRTPVLAGGKLYVRDPPAGTIYDAANGSILGTFASASAPAVTATTGFYLNNGTLNWVDLQSAAQTHSFSGDGSLVTTPIVIDEAVIVGSSAGNLYALDTQSGVLSWQTLAPAGIFAGGDSQNTDFFTGLAAADGVLIVPAGNKLVAYSLFGPAAPANLTATAGPGSIKLTWAASAGATAYNVYRASGPGLESISPVQTGVSGTTSLVTTGLTEGTTYYFTVKRSDAAGISAASNEASAAAISPLPPKNLTAKSAARSVTLSWTASSGATSYEVYQSTVAGGEPATPVLSAVVSTQAKLASLVPGTKYYFKVKAVAYSFTSAGSEEASAVAVTAAPTNLSAKSGAGQVTLTWNAVSGASSYNAYIGTAAGLESTVPAKSSITGNSVTLTGLQSTQYYFVVRAVAGSATSAPSNEVSATPTSPSSGGGGGGLDIASLLALTVMVASRLNKKRKGVQPWKSVLPL